MRRKQRKGGGDRRAHNLRSTQGPQRPAGLQARRAAPPRRAPWRREVWKRGAPRVSSTPSSGPRVRATRATSIRSLTLRRRAGHRISRGGDSGPKRPSPFLADVPVGACGPGAGRRERGGGEPFARRDASPTARPCARGATGGASSTSRGTSATRSLTSRRRSPPGCPRRRRCRGCRGRGGGCRRPGCTRGLTGGVGGARRSSGADAPPTRPG